VDIPLLGGLSISRLPAGDRAHDALCLVVKVTFNGTADRALVILKSAIGLSSTGDLDKAMAFCDSMPPLPKFLSHGFR